jgi:hypothetical protein
MERTRKIREEKRRLSMVGYGFYTMLARGASGGARNRVLEARYSKLAALL